MKKSLTRSVVLAVILITGISLLSNAVLAQTSPYFTYTGSFNYDADTKKLTTTVLTIDMISYMDGSMAPNYYFDPFTVDDSLIGGTFTLGDLYNSDTNNFIFGPSPGGSIGNVSFSLDSGGTNYLTGTLNNFTVTQDEFGTRLNPNFNLNHVVNISTNSGVNSKFLDDVNSFAVPVGNLHMDFNFTSGTGINNFTETAGGTITGEFTVAPEPVSAILFVTGGITLAFRRYRKIGK